MVAAIDAALLSKEDAHVLLARLRANSPELYADYEKVKQRNAEASALDIVGRSLACTKRYLRLSENTVNQACSSCLKATTCEHCDRIVVPVDCTDPVTDAVLHFLTEISRCSPC
jgi:hypothetical protein